MYRYKSDNLDRLVGQSRNHKDPLIYRFKPIMQNLNREMREVNRETWGMAQKTLDAYFAGDASVSDVRDVFLDCIEKNRADNIEHGYAYEDNPEELKKAGEEFYLQFRIVLLQSALDASNAQGRERYPDQREGFYYYNSDFYFTSQEALNAVEGALDNYTDEMGLDRIELPEYENPDLYDNFTTRWGDRYSYSYISLNVDKVPPRDFVLAYQPDPTSGHLEITIGGETREASTYDFESGVFSSVNSWDLIGSDDFGAGGQLEAFLSQIWLHNTHWMSNSAHRPFSTRA